MKVLYFHQHFSTPRGATAIRSYEMAKHLIARGHQVTMVCGSYQGGETELTAPFLGGLRRGKVDGIDVIEFNLAYSNHDGFIKRAMTMVKFGVRSVGLALTESYDLVFATSTPLTSGIPGIFARWMRGKRFVFEVRDLWPELPREMGVIKNPLILGMLSGLEWLSYRSAHRIIGLSPGMVEGIARRGISKKHIEMVPNGCDLGIFGQGLDAWRPMGVAETDLMAIFTGTHGIANGLEAVLDAAVELKARGRDDIKLVLVGQGMLKPGLQKRVEKEGLSNVIFHDAVNKSRLAGLMASADLGMQILANVPAFYFGTSPNKFFDYIAAGLPVLNNYPGWLAQLIDEHFCGFAVPPADPVAFADALERAANDRESLKKMGENSRRLAGGEFHRAKLADRFVGFLETSAAR